VQPTTYEWDGVGRLTAINRGTSRTEFAYDGLGRRVRQREIAGITLSGTGAGGGGGVVPGTGTLQSERTFLY
jgi:YD repeat-containing protein